MGNLSNFITKFSKEVKNAKDFMEHKSFNELKSTLISVTTECLKESTEELTTIIVDLYVDVYKEMIKGAEAVVIVLETTDRLNDSINNNIGKFVSTMEKTVKIPHISTSFDRVEFLMSEIKNDIVKEDSSETVH
jgi:6-phosphogluconate dehydrogenase